MTAAKNSGDLEKAEANVNMCALILYGIRIRWGERRKGWGREVGKQRGNEGMTEDQNRLTKPFVYNCLSGLRRKNETSTRLKYRSEQSRLLGSTRGPKEAFSFWTSSQFFS